MNDFASISGNNKDYKTDFEINFKNISGIDEDEFHNFCSLVTQYAQLKHHLLFNKDADKKWIQQELNKFIVKNSNAK